MLITRSIYYLRSPLRLGRSPIQITRSRILYSILSILELLLVVRFIALSLQKYISPEIVSAISNFTEPLVLPFKKIFYIVPESSLSWFPWFAPIAMIAYAIIVLVIEELISDHNVPRLKNTYNLPQHLLKPHYKSDGDVDLENRHIKR